MIHQSLYPPLVRILWQVEKAHAFPSHFITRLNVIFSSFLCIGLCGRNFSLPDIMQIFSNKFIDIYSVVSEM